MVLGRRRLDGMMEQIDVSASIRDIDFESLELHLYDGADNLVPFMEEAPGWPVTLRDGQQEETLVSTYGTVSTAGDLRLRAVRRVDFVAIDAFGGASEPFTTAFAEPAQRALGERCDPLVRADRCAGENERCLEMATDYRCAALEVEGEDPDADEDEGEQNPPEDDDPNENP